MSYLIRVKKYFVLNKTLWSDACCIFYLFGRRLTLALQRLHTWLEARVIRLCTLNSAL